MATGQTGTTATVLRDSVLIPDVISFSYINPSREYASSKELDDVFETILPTRISPETLEITLTFDYTQYAVFMTDMINRTIRRYDVDHTGIHSWGNGYITEMSNTETDGNSVIQYTVTITFSGAITLSV